VVTERMWLRILWCLYAMMFHTLDRSDLSWLVRSASKRRPLWLAWPVGTAWLPRAIAVFALMIGAAAAFDEGAVKPLGPVKFNIPGESLIDALQAYSTQSGVQVMFETTSAAGYQSAPVQGEFAPEVALRALLANTDLRIRYSRPTAITLAPASAPNLDEPPAHALTSADMALDTLRVSGAAEPDRHRFDQYTGAVQADIQKALKKLVETRRGDYRIAVKVWVNPSRTIERAELQGSTGDRERDSTITGTLRGLMLNESAPPNTPQPMLFMISISALRTGQP
jgi:hypothetical protein